MLRYSAVAPFLLAAMPLLSQPCDPLPRLNGMQNGLVSEAARAEYRADRDTHPDDPMYLTQYARALTGVHTPEAVKVLDRALEVQPGYPPALLQLALIYNSQVFHDAARLKTNLQAYWKACPESIEGFSYIGRTDDQEFMRASAARLRPLIEKSEDPRAIAAYRTLWSIEFKATPLAAQDALRERVRQDAARLRQLDFEKYPMAVMALDEAYKVLGDPEGTKWVEAHRPARAVAGQSAAQQEIMRWRMDHPMKGDFMTYQETVAKQSEEWIKKWPDDPYARMERFNALMPSREVALEDQVQAAQDWIRVYEQHPSGTPPYMQVANFYNSRNMRYAELPELVDKGLKTLKPPVLPPASDLYRQPLGSRIMQHSMEWSAWGTAASVYVRVKRYNDAREILDKFAASLKEFKPAKDAGEGDRRMYGNWERQYWDNMAKLAQAEGHRLDQMAYLRSAGLASPFPSTMNGEPHWKVQTRQIWKDLGGTDEGYEAWIAQPVGGDTAAKVPARPVAVATAGRWTTMDKPLADFQFSDARGKTWTVADLKGKVTLINLWATWCGPCRNELPYLQKLYDKVRDRKDVQVITFNVDDNPGLILPFVAENKYSFPVLPAKDYIDRMLGQWSIPRNWIVDAAGTLRSESIGFGVGEDKWVDDTVQAMEKAR